MNWNPEVWSRLLWETYLPSIESGYPVYFSIDRGLLQNIVISNDPGNSEDPIELLAKSCRQLFTIRGSLAELNENALCCGNDDFHSNAICLITLQIITVERMTEDDLYTENAYFPRLRGLMGFSDDSLHSNNPFLFRQFEDIWDTFRKEILRVPGSSIKTITFRKGYGRDLRRLLPISQALLSQSELDRLRSKLSDSGGSIRSVNSTFEFILLNRQLLSERSRCIVNAACQLVGRKILLASQLQEYINNPVSISSRKRKSELQNFENILFSAFWSSDIFDPDSVSVYSVDASGVVVADRTFADIIRYCENGKYLIFSEIPSGFAFQKSSCTLDDSESILVICALETRAVIQYTLNQYSNSEVPVTEVDCSLPSGFVAFSAEISGMNIKVSGGKIELPEDQTIRRSPITVSGGIVIDGRRKHYLAPYFPQRFYFNGREINDKEFIVINNQEVTLGEFKIGLSVLEHEEASHYEFRYKDSKVTFAIIPNNPCVYRPSLGFVYRARALCPQLSILENETDFLSGMQLSIPQRVIGKREHKERLAAICIYILKRGCQGVEISKSEFDGIVGRDYREGIISKSVYLSITEGAEDSVIVPPEFALLHNI
jgi:hypothetical protein